MFSTLFKFSVKFVESEPTGKFVYKNKTFKEQNGISAQTFRLVNFSRRGRLSIRQTTKPLDISQKVYWTLRHWSDVSEFSK